MSHTQRCLDSNRFGDGFDCICDQDPLRKALRRVAELEEQLAGHAHRIDCDNKTIAKLEDRMVKMLSEMAEVETHISAAIMTTTELVPVPRDQLLEWAVRLGAARYVKPDRIRELAIALGKAWLADSVMHFSRWAQQESALQAEIERVLAEEKKDG